MENNNKLNLLFDPNFGFPWGTHEKETQILNESNIDDFIAKIDEKKAVPLSVRNYAFFRDYCIEKNRFDLVVQCTLPGNLFNDEKIINGLCNQLNTNPSNLFSKINWLKTYHKQNINIFNTVLASSLRDDIFNLNKSHYERFINHIEIQADIAKLNEQQIKVLSRILDNYSYQDYDLSFAITNIVNNLNDYNELINSIDIKQLSNEQIKLLVSVLQNPQNPYRINNLADLENYTAIKKKALISNFNTNTLEENKTNMLQALFNIDLKEAEYIYEQFCHNNLMVETLESSELPKENFVQLKLISDIINCNNQSELANLYNQLHSESVYSCELPLETYLRRIYNNLYSISLYNANNKDQVYGPKEHIKSKDTYNNHEVPVYFPRTKFNFMSHVVGYCSLKKDVISSNYAEDWLDRPQFQDHMVACSYMTEESLGSISKDKPIICFDHFEGGAMLAMSHTDIDSIGFSKLYNGARLVQEMNHVRAKYYVPSALTKAKIKSGGYSELLLERRDTKKQQSLTKRAPSYIMTVVPTLRDGQIARLDTIFEELSFISQEDRTQIREQSSETEIKNILNNYIEIFNWYSQENGFNSTKLIQQYANRISKAVIYEKGLKAATEFNVPLVVIDQENTFRRILDRKTQYDEKTKATIFNSYVATSSNQRRQKIWKAVCLDEDISEILPQKEQPLKDYWNNNEFDIRKTFEGSSDYDYIASVRKTYKPTIAPSNSISQYLKSNYNKYERYLEEKRTKAEEEKRRLEELELSRKKELEEKAKESVWSDGLGDEFSVFNDDFEII
ncbi:MAG: hypothetical protein IJW59_00095 [Clostridia bacterium]|nr:hypothetical protein [Clostridia bacterium]